MPIRDFKFREYFIRLNSNLLVWSEKILGNENQKNHFVDELQNNEESLNNLFKFDYLSKRVEDAESLKTLSSIMKDELHHADDSIDTLENIMKDELVHHGMAKKFYESKFPNAKLQIAFKRERIKNRLRLFYYKNLKFLNKIFDPILNFLIFCFGKIVNFISVPDTNKKNLMLSNSKSVV